MGSTKDFFYNATGGANHFPVFDRTSVDFHTNDKKKEVDFPAHTGIQENAAEILLANSLTGFTRQATDQLIENLCNFISHLEGENNVELEQCITGMKEHMISQETSLYDLALKFKSNEANLLYWLHTNETTKYKGIKHYQLSPYQLFEILRPQELA